ncbi:MAG: hypothetical protein WBA74_13570 [Cyclobacteriaceae bacterium]
MMDKETLKEKEVQLRQELNTVSGEFEEQMLKAAGLAIVGGIVSYGIYKLATSGDDEEEEEYRKPKKRKENRDRETVVTRVEPYSPSIFSRVLNALIPIVVSGIGAEILKNMSTDNEPEIKKTIVVDGETNIADAQD